MTEESKAPTYACGECQLYKTAMNPCCSGQGSVPCDIMIILEIPAYSREQQKTTAISNGVQTLMNKYLREMGMPEDTSIYYTTAVHCRPPNGRSPTPAEVKGCSKVLELEIARVQPKYVLLMGASALKGTLRKGNITQIHGQIFEENGIKYLPTFHPMAVERDPSKLILLRSDLRKFVSMVQGKVQERYNLNMFILNGRMNLDTMLDDLQKKSAIGFDLETSHLNMYKPEEKVLILGIGDLNSQWIIPMDWPGCSWENNHGLQSSLLEEIQEVLHGKKVVGHNVKFDNKWLTSIYNIRFPATFDTMLAGHVLNETLKKSLKYQAQLFFDVPNWDISSDEKTGHASFRTVATYCAWDVFYTMKLYEKYKADLLRGENASVRNVFTSEMMPASDAFEIVEANGVYLNLPKYNSISEEVKLKVADLSEKLDKFAPGLNWNSSAQVGKLMFTPKAEGGWGLKPIEYTPGGKPSVGEAVLKQLQGQNPAIDLKLEYNKYAKLLSSFVNGWQEYIMPDSRMHPTFRLEGTETGRLSCSDPNLQQVPRVKDGIDIRTVISAPEGWTFVEADYSQIELRIAAMIANEKEMLKIFREKITDIHSATARIITGKKDVSKEERFRAKAVNFGFLYGMGARTFQEYAFTDYGQRLTYEQAQEFRNRFFTAYPGLVAWHEAARREVRVCQQVMTATGRIRHLLDIMSPDEGKASGAERQAINTPVQSLASDIALCSLIELQRKLDPAEVKIVGSVHDAVLFEVRNDAIEKTLPKIKEIMENPEIIREKFKINLTVPIEVEIKVAKGGWGS